MEHRITFRALIQEALNTPPDFGPQVTAAIKRVADRMRPMMVGRIGVELAENRLSQHTAELLVLVETSKEGDPEDLSTEDLATISAQRASAYKRGQAEAGKECKGKAAARSLAVMVLDPKINLFLATNDPKALEQAMKSLEPFGYPNTDALKAKLGL